MTSTDVALVHASQSPFVAERLSVEQIKYIQNTDLVPKNYRGNVAAIMACVLTGRALGLDDMASLRWIYVVDGRATLATECMVTLTRQKGHSITGKVTDKEATVTGRRVDNGDEMTVTWTIEMAQRAGLAGKQNWKHYPEAMLWSRAVSQLVRMLFSDVLLGLAYTADEMGDVTVEVPGEGTFVGEAELIEDDPIADEPAEAESLIVHETPVPSEEATPDTDSVGDGGTGEFTFDSLIPEAVKKGKAA